MWVIEECQCTIRLKPAVATPSTMNSQRQPRTLYVPSRVEGIAPETMLPKAPERIPADRKIMKHLDPAYFG